MREKSTKNVKDIANSGYNKFSFYHSFKNYTIYVMHSSPLLESEAQSHIESKSQDPDGLLQF